MHADPQHQKEAKRRDDINRALAASKAAWDYELNPGSKTGKRVAAWFIRLTLLTLGGVAAWAFHSDGNETLAAVWGGLGVLGFIVAVFSNRGPKL